MIQSPNTDGSPNFKGVPLTYLEQKILEDIVRPSLNKETPDYLGSRETISQTLNFSTLLENIKSFYERNGGKEWGRLLNDHRV